MLIGYVIASNEVMVLGKPVGYFYRESPDNSEDSGWRVFSGEETQEFADDPKNFAMYNATSIVDIAPEIAQYLGADFPIAYEREGKTGDFIEVTD